MTIRYPTPLQPGDRVGVTSPSSGVAADLRPRLEFCLDHLRRRGYDVVVGDTAREWSVPLPVTEPRS